MPPSERRIDIGGKVLGAVLSAAIIVVMGGTYYRANGAVTKADINTVNIAEIKVTQDFTQKSLDKIDTRLEHISSKL